MPCLVQCSSVVHAHVCRGASSRNSDKSSVTTRTISDGALALARGRLARALRHKPHTPRVSRRPHADSEPPLLGLQVRSKDLAQAPTEVTFQGFALALGQTRGYLYRLLKHTASIAITYHRHASEATAGYDLFPALCMSRCDAQRMAGGVVGCTEQKPLPL